MRGADRNVYLLQPSRCVLQWTSKKNQSHAVRELSAEVSALMFLHVLYLDGMRHLLHCHLCQLYVPRSTALFAGAGELPLSVDRLRNAFRQRFTASNREALRYVTSASHATLECGHKHHRQLVHAALHTVIFPQCDGTAAKFFFFSGFDAFPPLLVILRFLIAL